MTASSRSNYCALSCLTILVIVLLDQATKLFMMSSYSLGQSIPLFETRPLSLFWTMVTNKGAAWGMFSLVPHLLLTLRALILIALAVFWAKTKSLSCKLFASLIIGGAISNILDVLFYGSVIDFIHFRFYTYDYPVFNGADASIFLGTFGLIYHLTFKKK